MELLERIWEFTTHFFSGILSGFEKAVTGVFGSSNARYVKRLQGRVEQINALEAQFEKLSDEELKQQTARFRQRLRDGETLDDLLVEAFAVCREGGKRFLHMRHYDVQLIGGMVLHSGSIAEMVTGEGKTLVATLPAYLNALDGKGVHVVTVNDYLARRDMEWMAPLYMGLGLTVGAIQSNMDVSERQRAYDCDITYGTNNEFGFDYLRDNMRPAARGDDRYPKHLQQSQGPLHYAIIDEVDNILIDEARTPLIISGPAHDNPQKYVEADRIARQLQKDVDFEVSEKEHTATLTDAGIRRAEKLAGVESFYTAGNMDWPHLLDNSLKAHHLYKRDVNYVVKEGRVVIVDEFTGRLMEGRQWSDGLHQAVEAKEGVKIKEETQTLATITLQNFFKLYDKLGGMTGTAMTEAHEFWKIYKLDVVAIPTNRDLQRVEFPDVIYRSEREKFRAVAEEIEGLNRWDVATLKNGEQIWGELIRESDDEVVIRDRDKRKETQLPRKNVVAVQRRGRPVLVGTVSIEKSERLSRLLTERGVKHEVLNAKYHQREAEIVAQAGRIGSVTIATNMAGRGTDIILGGNPETLAWARLQDKYATRLDVPNDEWDALVKAIDDSEKMSEEGKKVKSLGGLHVIGTERHDARRIDLQLRGRCGRQGDPGSSRFFLSLEDDLMRIFASAWVKTIMERIGGMQEGDYIESPMVSKRIAAAQKKREEFNFEARKNLLEYDEVMDEQRKRVYRFRQDILEGVSCRDVILRMIREQTDQHLKRFLQRDYGVDSFAAYAGAKLASQFDGRDFRGMDFEQAELYAREQANRQAESNVVGAIDENLPDGPDDDESDWNWGALASFANQSWGLNLRDRDLKKFGRDRVDEFLLEKAREAIARVDLGDGREMLEEDFAIRQALAWVRNKFGIEIAPAEVADIAVKPFVDLVCQRASKAYDEKESQYPVMAGIYRFSEGTGPQRRVDRHALLQWARERFQAEISEEDFRNKQREEILELLVQYSQKTQQEAESALREVHQKVAEFFGDADDDETVRQVSGGNGALDSLAQWMKQSLHCELPTDRLEEMNSEQLERTLSSVVEDRYRPEMRRMERSLLLEIVDSSWKDHLLAMDHLKSSVGLAGYAQMDPKVEYKREGMKLFERMWESIGERTTDYVFRIENLNEDFVGSTWVESAAVHESPDSLSDIASQQQEAIEGSQNRTLDPIRNRGEKIGRNDPCPCGSGKKYKACHLRTGGWHGGKTA